MISEEFELIIHADVTDDLYDWSTEEYRPEVKSEIRDLVLEAFPDARDPQVQSWGVGYGAAGPVLLVVLGGLWTLFLQGKSIEENIEVWPRLFRKFLAKIKARFGNVQISQPGALAVAVLEVLKTESIDLLRLRSSEIIAVPNSSVEDASKFSSQPDRYYLFTFDIMDRETNSQRVEIVCLRSDGGLQFRETILLNRRALDWTQDGEK